MSHEQNNIVLGGDGMRAGCKGGNAKRTIFFRSVFECPKDFSQLL